MSLLENFDDAVDSMKSHAVTVGVVIATAFSMSACGSIPVGQIVEQNAKQNLFTARKGIVRAVVAPVRLTPCTIQQQPKQQEPGIVGSIVGALEKTFSLNTTVSVGDPTCGQGQSQGQQVDRNGVARLQAGPQTAP